MTDRAVLMLLIAPGFDVTKLDKAEARGGRHWSDGEDGVDSPSAHGTPGAVSPLNSEAPGGLA